MKGNCNLKVIQNDDLVNCRALCLIHKDYRCCEECNEISKCKRVCGFVRDQRKNTMP